MAAKKEERITKAGRGDPTRGQERSTKGKVRPKKQTVKTPSLSPAQKAAKTRQREAVYRERVRKQLAREQIFRARRQIREAKQAQEALVEARKVEAAKALLEEQARFEAAKSTKRSDKEEREALERLLAKRFESELAGNHQVGDLKEIRLGREILEEQIAKYYIKAKAEGKIKPISPRHPTGKTWTHESRARSGAVVDRFVGRFLREDTIDATTRRLLLAAKKAKDLRPDGSLYVSFSIVEYGRGVPKSPGPPLYADALGSFYPAYDGTARLTPAQDLAGFEAQVRQILENRVKSAGSANAIMIDSFEVKSYHQRSNEEIREYDRAKRKAEREKFEAAMREAIIGAIVFDARNRRKGN